jgi:hypothetical protein
MTGPRSSPLAATHARGQHCPGGGTVGGVYGVVPGPAQPHSRVPG